MNDDIDNVRKNVDSVNFTNQTMQENRELKYANDQLTTNLNYYTQQIKELQVDREENEFKLRNQVKAKNNKLNALYNIKMASSNARLKSQKSSFF